MRKEKEGIEEWEKRRMESEKRRADEDAVRAGVAEGAGIAAPEVVKALVAAGFTPEDIIVAIDGKDIHKSTDLFKALDAHKVGDAIDVTVRNQSGKRTVKVTLQPIQ